MYSERGKEEIKLCQREREEEKISLLSLLPPNSLVISIGSFFFLLYLFYFVFVFTFVIFALFILFCHGDGYKHTPN
jgi:hypothetical protein